MTTKRLSATARDLSAIAEACGVEFRTPAEKVAFVREQMARDEAAKKAAKVERLTPVPRPLHDAIMADYQHHRETKQYMRYFPAMKAARIASRSGAIVMLTAENIPAVAELYGVPL